VVNVHGSSGFTESDMQCRVKQFEAAFSLLGDRNLLLGDLNTDPGRSTEFDPSAAVFADGVTGELQFISDVGPDAVPTYVVYNIDHVVSDAFDGACHDEVVTDIVYFDHRPQVCALTAR
jgi:hypothetical protein